MTDDLFRKNFLGGLLKKRHFLLGIIIGIIVGFFVFYMGGMLDGLFSGESNKQTMKEICNTVGGEPYLYKMGWSSICGFDVYRGFCIQSGEVNEEEDYALIDGNAILMDSLPKFDTEAYNNLWEKQYELHYEEIERMQEEMIQRNNNETCALFKAMVINDAT